MERLRRAIRLIVELDHRQRVTILVTVLVAAVATFILFTVGGAPHETVGKGAYKARPTKTRTSSKPARSRSNMPPPPQESTPAADDSNQESAESPADTPSNGNAGEAPESATPASENGGSASQESNRPSKPAPPEKVKTAAEKVAERARKAMSPEVGLKLIEKNLEELLSRGDASRLHSAQSELHLQTDPPNAEAAKAAVAKALELAETPEEKDLAGYAETNMYRRLGDTEQAKARARAVLDTPGPATVPRLKLGLLDASIRAEEGAAEEAESSYKQVMEEAQAHEAALGAEADEVYRLAALRLNRLYRAAGRDVEADAVAKEVRERAQE